VVHGTQFEDHWPGVGLCSVEGEGHLFDSYLTYCSVVCIATGYGLTIRGLNPGGGEIFRTCPERPLGPPSLLCNGYRVFPEGKERPEPDADTSPPSSVVVKKE